MKIVALIARLLLGLVFTAFGLNGFLNFMPMGPMPSGTAGQFLGALFASHFALVVSGTQVIGGVLLLVNRYTVLGLTLLGPVIVNILSFHILMLRQGLPLAIVVGILWCILAWRYRRHFASLFVQRAE
jgi:hypothetical protein